MKSAGDIDYAKRARKVLKLAEELGLSKASFTEEMLMSEDVDIHRSFISELMVKVPLLHRSAAETRKMSYQLIALTEVHSHFGEQIEDAKSVCRDLKEARITLRKHERSAAKKAANGKEEAAAAKQMCMPLKPTKMRGHA